MSLKKYVIVGENSQGAILNDFLNNSQNTNCQIVNAINPKTLELLPDLNLIFNLEKANKILNRHITVEEISTTLSHINCWRLIAEDHSIDENEFVVIVEPIIDIAENAYRVLEEEINRFLVNSKYNIFLLQSKESTEVYSGVGDIHSIVYSNPITYNSLGESFYAIRKRTVFEILDRLVLEKPYWKADYFSEFCFYENIACSNVPLGKERVKKSLPQFKKSLNPKFSIIIPIYNTQDYLEEAIESVLKQDYINYEIILIDDGSTDESKLICRKYVDNYPHITLIEKANTGNSDSRNQGINIAKGEYIMFLDSDDYWYGSSILSDLDNLSKDNDPDLIITYMKSMYPDGKMVSHLVPLSSFSGNFVLDSVALIKEGIWRGFPAIKVVKRSLLLENKIYFPTGISWLEDVLWTFNLSKVINNYVEYHNDFYVYRRNRDGSVTRHVDLVGVIDMFKVVELCYKDLLNRVEDGRYLSLLLLVQETLEYSLYCYELLSDEDKERIREKYPNFEIISNEINLKLIEK